VDRRLGGTAWQQSDFLTADYADYAENRENGKEGLPAPSLVELRPPLELLAIQAPWLPATGYWLLTRRSFS
jgi:hypothetical protein